MFERFTNQARRVVVKAQEEAAAMRHNYIGTEHLLLGLLGEADSAAARVLERFGMTLTSAREEVAARVGPGKDPVKGHVPFTPRAKKCLELSLREALQLGHNYIGTEHLLLGLIREGDGVGAKILAAHAADMSAVRQAVIDILPADQPSRIRSWTRRREENEEPEEIRATPAADTSLNEAVRLAGTDPVGSHHLLLAALADPDTAASRTLTGLGLDLQRAREALRRVDLAGTSDERPEEMGRRHMRIRVTKSSLTIEATDPEILELGHATMTALGDRAREPGTIHGDLPNSASLSTVWAALRDSLEDIRRRATAASQAQEGSEAQQGGKPRVRRPRNRRIPDR